MTKKMLLLSFTVLVSVLLLNGCGGGGYDPGYSSYESKNDREVNRVISQEMNSLSDADIAQLNKLK